MCDVPRPQPTTDDMKSAILLFPGPVVTFRAFRQCAPHFVRGSTKNEFHDALEQLKPDFGSVLSARVARSTQPTKVFVKRQLNMFATWPSVNLCQLNDYNSKYNLPLHKSITNNIKDLLLRQNQITLEQYNA